MIYLIRHPAPVAVQGLCYGRSDVPVDAAVSRTAAHAVRRRIPAHVFAAACVFTSPATRCRGLAGDLAHPQQPRVADDLAEIDFGTWEGRPWDAVPRDELEAWNADLWHYRPGGAESASMVAARWQRFAAGLDAAADSIVVTHAGVIRVALACAGLRDLAGPANPVPFASVHPL